MINPLVLIGVLLIGGGIGGLIMNHVCWRGQQRALDVLFARADERDADLDALDADLNARYADYKAMSDARYDELLGQYIEWERGAVEWCRDHAGVTIDAQLGGQDG